MLGVPVFDSVTSAVMLAESLVRLGKTTSKAGAFAPPSSVKSWERWPISAIG
jgi:allantoin racemase